MASTTATLDGCVTSLRASMSLLESSLSILDTGVSDLPRLSTVLQTRRHFELVSEADLLTAQSGLAAEIAPEVETLLSRVESHLDRLERREKSLMAKCELQEGRLSRSSASQPQQQQQTGGEPLTQLQSVKAMQLRQKKERLSYAVGRLELQAGQRERQLRKSMAVQGVE